MKEKVKQGDSLVWRLMELRGMLWMEDERTKWTVCRPCANPHAFVRIRRIVERCFCRLWVMRDSLGVQGKKVSHQGVSGCLEVWAGLLSEGRITVLLWNRCSISGSIIAQWQYVGLQPGTVVTVRDLWQHITLPQTFNESLVVEVKPHSCEMYILTPKEGIYRIENIPP
ncbi:hypothetical protein O6H91_12G066600 [Diphasiastrum complanatum]|uniref:Uncharacterized protein n=1 Tax=Diphasiastrum complanatum TaxID=34168 RepID=A0ACC2C336_DIPCM|nr:hypothetical protein O6H91_12G066600 [Diphasiastrum complanatum]